MKKSAIAIIVAVIALAIFLFSSYNGLVTTEEQVNTQWANVESKLQRRYDLIPNLVEAVRGSMQQEQEVFGNIADARARMAGATTQDEQIAAANNMESALGRLLVVMENYPQLRSNENVQRLMDELAGTENRISVERDKYNEVVRTYNTKIRQIPTSIFAGMLGFSQRSYFEANPDAQVAPKVDLNVRQSGN